MYLYIQFVQCSGTFLQTGQKVPSDYVMLRERLSEQRRDVERALTRFVAKTGKSHPLLPHDKNAFPRELYFYTLFAV